MAYRRTASQNPLAGYTKVFIETKMTIPQSGGRREMPNLKAFVMERDPGQLSREPWAGRFADDAP